MVLLWLHGVIVSIWNSYAHLNQIQDIIVNQEQELEKQKAELRNVDSDLSEQCALNIQLESTNYNLEQQLKLEKQNVSHLTHELEAQTQMFEILSNDAKIYNDKFMKIHKDVLDKSENLKKENGFLNLKLTELQHQESHLRNEIHTQLEIIHEYERCIKTYSQKEIQDQEEIRRLLDDISQECEKHNELKKQLVSCKQQMQNLEKNQTGFERKFRELEKSELDLISKSKILQENVKDLQLQLQNVKLDYEKSQREIETKEKDISDYKLLVDTLAEELKHNTSTIIKLQDNLLEKKIIIENLRKVVSFDGNSTSDGESIKNTEQQLQATMQEEERLNRLSRKK